MSTNVVSARDVKRTWYHIDAKGMVLGRLAVQVADKLRGKSKVNFVPYLAMGDFVVVTNASLVKVTGKKATDKKYTRHSGFPGGLRVDSFNALLKANPNKIIEHAVKGMLPGNKLGDVLIRKLHVFPGDEHTFQRQLSTKAVKTTEVKEDVKTEEAVS
jgi:large subunit ribosomal protein L13